MGNGLKFIIERDNNYSLCCELLTTRIWRAFLTACSWQCALMARFWWHSFVLRANDRTLIQPGRVGSEFRAPNVNSHLPQLVAWMGDFWHRWWRTPSSRNRGKPWLGLKLISAHTATMHVGQKVKSGEHAAWGHDFSHVVLDRNCWKLNHSREVFFTIFAHPTPSGWGR